MQAAEQAQAVAAIKTWATGAYEAGGDVIVEAFTDEEIVEEFIADTRYADILGREPQPAATVAEALKRAQDFCSLRASVRDDVIGYGR